ncbi:MAG TPA: ABC transporter permease [Chitinophagaceae bacterium]|jgi:putative ABC transport system permease protein
MFKNYFKAAWRNMLKGKANSFINIAGLSIGLACVIFILLYVQDELSYDKFLKDADHIYQVNLDGNIGGQEFLGGGTPPPAGAALVNEFPEIETYTRIYQPGNTVVRYKGGNATENYFSEKNIWAVDSNFLQVFSYAFKEGNVATCLQKINSVVVTENTATKYFGGSSPIGKTLLLGDEKIPFTVTAVLRNLPSQSSFQFDILTPVSSYPAVKRFSWSWVWLQVITYVKIRDNVANDDAAIKKLETKFPSMVKVQAASAFERVGQPFDEFLKNGGRWDLRLQRLTDIHLYSAGVGSRLTTLSDIKYVYIFSIIALFIIILACVNFMNLSTAQSAKRAKEVGIRKVLGSVKQQLVKQFLTEAMLYSFISAIIALTLVALLLQPFNQLIGKSLSFASLFSNFIWLFILALTIITGLLAGSYPAFYLTSFKPILVLKGISSAKTSISSLFIRNGLVIFQFTISIILIICTIILFEQLRYTQTKDLGLNKENVLVISNVNRLGNSEKTFRDELSKMPEISSATISTSIPTGYEFTDGYVPEPSGNKEQLVKDISLTSFIVDENFIPTLQIKVLKGRNFSKEFSDSASVILNEAAAQQIGWKEPLGQYIQYPGGDNQRFRVIGIVKDFNIESLRNTVVPFALFHVSSKTYDIGKMYISARVKPGKINAAVNKLQRQWKSFAPDTPFEYNFLDEEFGALYSSEQRMSVVFTLFTALSIFVACLGLFGLAAYTAERRRKEIGIRKVLGASVQSVVAILSTEFVKMVLIASLIAFPVGWWAMNKWLEDFAYRISIEWWVFVVAGAVAMFIALATVSFQAVKAAIANPVKSLRTE